MTGAIKGGKSASNKKVVFIFVIALLLCTVSVCVSVCVAFSVKIFELQSEITTHKTQGVSRNSMLQEKTAHNYSDIEAILQLLNHNLSQKYSTLQIIIRVLS